jgi:hypothetical protein
MVNIPTRENAEDVRYYLSVLVPACDKMLEENNVDEYQYHQVYSQRTNRF